MMKAQVEQIAALAQRYAMDSVFSIRPGLDTDYDNFMDAVKDEPRSTWRLYGFKARPMCSKQSFNVIHGDLEEIHHKYMEFAIELLKIENANKREGV
jgi:hypothetical protein